MIKHNNILSDKIASFPHDLKIIIGASKIKYSGWIDTEEKDLNVVFLENWEAYFKPESIQTLLAEHVWEHITPENQIKATMNCFKFLKPGGLIRIAVPDGFRTDCVYQDEVLPPQDGHTMMFTYKSLEKLLTDCGFKVRLLEFFDEYGEFHHHPWHYDSGPIRRSLGHDTQTRFSRSQGSYQMNYTSLIADGIKPK